MKLIVETDIGRDADDFFALCYLISSGVDIKAITISPGDSDQVAVAKFILKEVGWEHIPVGVGKLGRNKSSAGGIHTKLLSKYKFPLIHKDDGYGPDIMRDIHKEHSDIEFFCIGPLTSFGKYLNGCNEEIKRVTMQGGFCGYDLHGEDVPILEKFRGKQTCSTFNLGGYIEGGKRLVSSDFVKERNFIGKNICHTIVYDAKVHEMVGKVTPKDRASELLREGMTMYLERHKEGKKFHDPSAAVCMLHPEIATWVKGKLYYEKGKWGTTLDNNGDNIAINIDYGKLWNFIANGI